MSELALPERLRGPWDHALILTYGMDLPFFEQAILRELPARCRNRIVLANGAHYLDVCATMHHDGLAHGFNQRYVAEGIFTAHAAHAKLVLLANPQQGCLLVGSGNLSWSGYASGGELFTQYEYSHDAPEQLAAFAGVRELLQGLLRRGYLSAAAERYVQLLLEQTPWLYYLPPSDDRPVRHNLEQSFLAQLQHDLGAEPVEELIVLSPFYDEHCRALETLLETLHPQQLTVLVQRDSTSLDPTALERVLGAFRGQWQVRPVLRTEGHPYIHAKLIIVKQRQRAVCLQGSPNLSQVALLRADPHGNIELANLLHGPRDAFDELLAALQVDAPVKRLASLGVSYQPIEASASRLTTPWQLRAASWNGTQLTVEYWGDTPDLRGGVVVLGGRAWAIGRWKIDGQIIVCGLDEQAAAQLSRPTSLRIRLADGSETNPVFICNTEAIDALLAVVVDVDDALSRVGGLDLDDQELETLLGLLDDALLIDQRSVWRAAGRADLDPATNEEEALRIDYSDIDYAMLRQHPRIQQYLRGPGGSRSARTRLQVILNAISQHFLDILEQATRADAQPMPAPLIPSTDQGEDEADADDAMPEVTQRTWGQQQRTERLLKGFIKRYLRGVNHPQFRELAGVEVLAYNHIIFSHILWRIWTKDWVDAEFMIGAMLQSWASFWGDLRQLGCIDDVAPELRTQVDGALREHHTRSTLLAALYDCSSLASYYGWHDLLIELRDFWRSYLDLHAASIDIGTLEEVWYQLSYVYPHQTPPPVAIVDRLRDLAYLETTATFLRALEQRYSYPPHSCRFERVVVNREHTGKSEVDCLVIDDPRGLQSLEEATQILMGWMQCESLDYYRVVSPASQGSQRVALYEVQDKAGVYWDRQTGQQTDLLDIVPSQPPWGAALSHLRTLAAELKVSIPVPSPQSTAPALYDLSGR